jgi:hypothetical protein
MNKPQRVPVPRLRVGGKRSGEKQRTLKDTLLISAWLAGYAGVLIAFRVVKAVQSVLSSNQWHRTVEEERGKSAPVE